MSRYISSNEIWDNIYQALSFPNSPKGGANFSFKEDYGTFSLKHYNTGFGIRYSSSIVNFNEDTILENTNSGNLSFLCINTGKGMFMEDTLKRKKVKFDSNICWNGQTHEGLLSKGLYLKNEQAAIHNITFDNKTFQELVKHNDSFENKKMVYKGDYIDVNFNNIINSKQKILINDLSLIPLIDDKLKMLYLESKLLDLVYTSLSSMQESNKQEEIYLNVKDIECLNKAKKVLIENMTKPLSLKELAHKCAINEFKLKRGFKQQFGNTVFGLLQERRLTEAKKLLETNDINVTEASILVGYKSAWHFSKIFKEFYGVLPIEIKKDLQKYIFN